MTVAGVPELPEIERVVFEAAVGEEDPLRGRGGESVEDGAAVAESLGAAEQAQGDLAGDVDDPFARAVVAAVFGDDELRAGKTGNDGVVERADFVRDHRRFVMSEQDHRDQHVPDAKPLRNMLARS